MISENDQLWYWFVNIKEIGNLTRKKLLARFGHPSTVYHAETEQLSKILKPGQMRQLADSKNREKIVRGMERLAEEKTRFIHWESPDYPEKLRHIPDPPYGIYLRGSLPDPSRPCLAMVGSRRATEYGVRIAWEFARHLSLQGIQVISGLADGIDTASHKGAVDAGGYTLGVLGGGIDTVYPRVNFNLYMHMYQYGGVLSEFNLGIANKPALFPMRNRLISALSDGVFVVEAAERSGTFITVDQALEQGKTVYALPGRITDPNSRGTNRLIQDGAIPALSPEEIIEQLTTEAALTKGEMISCKKGGPGKKASKAGPSADSLTKEQKTVLMMLDEQEPTEFSALLYNSGYEIEKLIHILYELEVLGRILQPRQNVYLKKAFIY